MGVRGNFWDLLKPYARSEGFDFLRNKRVAVDLLFWIVQNQNAIKGFTRNPHLRLTFFRTINLFAKFGAFPVFVVDGTPSHLKSETRMLRFFRGSGIDVSCLQVAEDGVSVERNGAFQKRVQECVELLELLGVPVLQASGEAEALCAQLNRDGHVDACITADSDAFLYGAKRVIKYLKPNSKDPLECYDLSDIEAGLGLKRSHLIAVSLLVGNDFDLNGVQGIGLDKAVRFVKAFSEDVILNRLQEIGRGDINGFEENIVENDILRISENLKSSHCSRCGHPGNKKAHQDSACNYCCGDTAGGSCIQKPQGFKCSCSACDLDRKAKQQKSSRDWQIKVCQKIHLEENFPNGKIIEMHMSDDQNLVEESQRILWTEPKTDLLIDLLSYSQNWEPSYIRQRMLPLLSTIYLRNMASNRDTNFLLCDQYEFHSIQRLKIRYGYQHFVVKWKKATQTMTRYVLASPVTPNAQQELGGEEVELIDLTDEPEEDVPQVYVEDGCWFLLTDEDIGLVREAFPEKVDEFFKEKALQEEKSKRRKKTNSESRKSGGVQLSIETFYQSTKVGVSRVDPQFNAHGSSTKNEDSPEGKRKGRSNNYSKSARRKLLFG